jgi:hypothetical protein
MPLRKYFGVRGKYISSIPNLPERIHPDRLRELVPKLRKGDDSVKEEIILGHLKLGAIIAGSYARYVGRDDDLFGQAQLAITKAVNEASRGTLYDNNITPYITAHIHSHIQKFYEEDKDVFVRGRTVRRWVERRLEKARQLPSKIAVVKGDITASDIEESVFVMVPEVMDDNVGIEIREILDKVTTTHIEKKIVELRSQGYTYEEISPKIGLGISRISQLLCQIEERFNKKWG